jgi:hypothetical protein
MAIEIFPIPAAASGASDTAFAAVIPAVQTTYEHDNEFTAGIYDIAIVPSSTNAQLTFVNASSVLLVTNTTNGIVTVQLNSAATKVFITTVTGGSADAVVKISKTAGILFPGDIGSGTLDTITTTGTYNYTGLLSVLAFGGGYAGGKGNQGTTEGAAGGAAGGVAFGMVYTNTATSVTVGTGGIAANSNNTNANAPGTSSFGNLLTSSTNDFFYVSGAGSGGSYNNAGNAGSASKTFVSFNGNSTTGGGGGGSAYRGSNGNMQGGSALGGGSGIGTGGASAPTGATAGTGGASSDHNPTTRGSSGTGYASGGGAGIMVGNDFPNANGRFGGNGGPGVVYVLRGF